MISSMIVAAIVIINPDITSIPSKFYTTREAISLEESMLGELSPNDFPCYWLQPQPQVYSEQNSNTTTQLNEIPPNDELIFEDSKNLNLLTIPSVGQAISNDNQANKSFQINYGTFFNNFKPKLTALISNTSLISSIEIQGYKISPNKRYLLIWIARKKQFRYSSTAKYFLYDIKLDLISILSTNQQQTMGDTLNDTPKQQVNSYENLDSASQFLNYYDEGNQFTRFQLVDWIQNTTDPNQESLVLIQNNDIYLLNLNINQEINSPIRLTFTGRSGEIFNGIPDWLYEEEILSDTPAYQVSQKADTLAYMSFNDSLVDVMAFTIYGSSEQILPRAQRIRYPKAGRVNPIVSVHLIVDLNNSNNNNERHNIKLKLPIDLSTQQHYINRIRWLNNDKLALIWLNRNQNESYIVICSRDNNWECEKNLHLKAKDGWLDMSDDLYPLNSDHYLAIILKHEGDDVGSFKHIAKVSIKEKNSFVYLTSGRKEVLNINGIDEKKSVVYYTSTVKNEPGQRQLFWANLDGINNDDLSQSQSAEDDKNDRCITCAHYPDECLFNHVKMSPSTRSYIFECLGPGIPRIELRSILVNNKQSINDDNNDNKNNNLDNNNPKIRLLKPLTLSEKSLELSNNFDSDTTHEQFKSSSLESNNFPTTITNNRLELPTTFSKVVQRTDNNNNQAAPIVDNTLLWTIENNQALKDKLTNNKAMPLTMRLKVPITNTSYFANVIMLLPPQLGPTNTFRALKSVNNLVANSNLRTSRSAILSSSNSIEQALHAYFTPDSISDYTNKLISVQKYPMVVDVYAGPGSQRVDYRFHVNFGHYLASSRRIIYVMIDGRGSGYEGTKRLYELYHKFGTVEIEDQIEVAAYLTRNYSFIDPNKVAIWGWSYGGYAAAMALAKSNSRALRNIQDKLNYTTPNNSKLVWSKQQNQLYSPFIDQSSRTPLSLLQNNDVTNKQTNINYSPIKGVFECAISVAPVTNWIYYDTTYTERFMSSPYLNDQYDNIQPNDHLQATSSSSSSYLNNNNKVSSSGSNQIGIVSNLHGHLQPIEDDKQKQNILSIDRLATSKWKPLNKTIETHPSLIDLVIQSSSSSSLPSAQQQKQPLPSLASPLTTTTTSRDKMNSFDLNDRYKTASLLEHIGNIDKKRFLLIHGTADDNVHFQQSIMLMKRLIQKNIMYETRLYPDQDHSIANKADKIHLGSTLSNFFSECFDMAY